MAETENTKKTIITTEDAFTSKVWNILKLLDTDNNNQVTNEEINNAGNLRELVLSGVLPESSITSYINALALLDTRKVHQTEDRLRSEGKPTNTPAAREEIKSEINKPITLNDVKAISETVAFTKPTLEKFQADARNAFKQQLNLTDDQANALMTQVTDAIKKIDRDGSGSFTNAELLESNSAILDKGKLKLTLPVDIPGKGKATLVL